MNIESYYRSGQTKRKKKKQITFEKKKNINFQNQSAATAVSICRILKFYMTVVYLFE